MDILHDATIWLAGSFIIFAAVLWAKGKSPFLNLIDTRIEQIRRDLATAETLKNEAQALLSAYKKRHAEAEAELKSMLSEAEDHARNIRAQAAQDLEDLLSRREAQTKARLKRMEETAVADIKSYAATLTVQATAGLIAEGLDKKGQAGLIDAGIQNAAGSLA